MVVAIAAACGGCSHTQTGPAKASDADKDEGKPDADQALFYAFASVAVGGPGLMIRDVIGN